MKYYLVKWPEGSAVEAVVGARSIHELSLLIDGEGDPAAAAVARMPKTPFLWDTEWGWDEATELNCPVKYAPYSEWSMWPD
jgi:hypothetical protein